MRKILVRAPNWLGDVLMSTPFLKRLREKEPEAAIHVLCRPAQREVFETFPLVDWVLLFARGEGPLALARRVRAGRYDAGYVLPPSFSSALLFRLAGVPERIGYATEFRGALLTRALPLDERFHYVRRYLGLLGEEGREISAEDLFFPKPSVKWGGDSKYFLSRLKTPCPSPMLAVAPGSRAPARRWPAEKFAALIDALGEREWPTVFLLGAAGDAEAAGRVASLCRRRVQNLCGRTELILAGDLLRRCAALVTNESGLMHVAWAVGTPTVVLAGPSDPRLTSPFGGRVAVVQRREVPCVPCVRNECYRPAGDFMECMKRIGVEEVREALRAVTTVKS